MRSHFTRQLCSKLRNQKWTGNYKYTSRNEILSEKLVAERKQNSEKGLWSSSNGQRTFFFGGGGVDEKDARRVTRTTQLNQINTYGTLPPSLLKDLWCYPYTQG
jgi:hypothetical protein